MALTKIDKMHYLYGKGTGNCKDCNRLKCYVVGDRNRKVYKCLNYGESNAESTDWRLKYEACGIKNNVACKPAIKIYIPKPKQKDNEINGQIKIEEVINENNNAVE